MDRIFYVKQTVTIVNTTQKNAATTSLASIAP